MSDRAEVDSILVDNDFDRSDRYFLRNWNNLDHRHMFDEVGRDLMRTVMAIAGVVVVLVEHDNNRFHTIEDIAYTNDWKVFLNGIDAVDGHLMESNIKSMSYVL